MPLGPGRPFAQSPLPSPLVACAFVPSVTALVFAKHFGGVFAIANIRGGSEYGEEWHKG